MNSRSIPIPGLPRPFDLLSLRELEWMTIALPLVFVALHHYLMVGPLHPFFHSLFGFSALMLPLGAVVWLFSRAVFGAVHRLQAENETLHEQAEVLIVEQERQHIAREMHDGLAQILSFVNAKAQAVEQFLRRGDQDAAREHLAELSRAVRDVYADIREGIVALQVGREGDRNLHQILEAYIEEFRNFSRLPVKIHWEIDDEFELPAPVELQVLRIVQEALTNARRHAQATAASVTFAERDGALVVTIDDDGVGFSPETVAPREGWPQFGLRSMRERAEAAGGDLEIESAPGEGATVRATFGGIFESARTPV